MYLASPIFTAPTSAVAGTLMEEGAVGSRSCADEKPESMSSSMDSRACATPKRATVVLDEEGEMGRGPFALALRAFWALDAKTVSAGSAIPGRHSKLHIHVVIRGEEEWGF